MKEVVITIRNTQAYDTDQEDRLDFTTDGTYDYDNETGACRLTYFESEVTGLPGTRTRVFIEPDGIMIRRDGTLTSSMEFKENKRNPFLYETPYGSATIGLRTRSIQKSFNATGGNAVIDYVLDLEHSSFISNRMELNVKEIHPQQ